MEKSARASIVVSPRERYSPIIESLESLFSTISLDVPVILIGTYPGKIQKKIRKLSRTRPFHHEMRDWPLIPNEARNIGTELVETEYVAYCDNDIIYEPGWLEALERHAERTGVEVVTPLICIGPPRASVIHHAGGVIYVNVDEKGTHLTDTHNLSNRPIEELEGVNLPQVTDTGEFHAVFARTDFIRKIGAFDERLITREHKDFALRVKHAGGRIGFEPESIITYNALTKLKPGDLSYHVFRWNHDDAVRSLDAFRQTWGVHLERDRILNSWIRNHRVGRIWERCAWVRRIVGGRVVKRFVMPWVEWMILRQIRRPAQRRLPREIPAKERDALIAQFVSRSGRRTESLEKTA